MKGFNSYMDAYMDRRMEALIQEWDLAGRRDLADMEARIRSLEEDTRDIALFEARAGVRLDHLEERLAVLKGARR
jgi:polyhydroxyalkanoate synthesis regulator phasin